VIIVIINIKENFKFFPLSNSGNVLFVEINYSAVSIINMFIRKKL
jgi:hypothetical protein